MTLRVVELFAGIGAPRKALTNIGVQHTSVISEIDKAAETSYNAVHGNTENLGDIRKIDKLPECDLLTYGFPCQDISIAGAQRGFNEGSGTRSWLLWEVKRLLNIGPLPKVLLCENVEAITHDKFIRSLNQWIRTLAEMGYTSSWEILNAKDFGIPQNRSRFFMVSCIDGRYFRFPKGRPSDLKLKDMLEENVDERYYLTEEQIANFEAHKDRHDAKGHGFSWQPTEGGGLSASLNTNPYRQNQNF